MTIPIFVGEAEAYTEASRCLCCVGEKKSGTQPRHRHVSCFLQKRPKTSNTSRLRYRVARQEKKHLRKREGKEKIRKATLGNPRRQPARLKPLVPFQRSFSAIQPPPLSFLPPPSFSLYHNPYDSDGQKIFSMRRWEIEREKRMPNGGTICLGWDPLLRGTSKTTIASPRYVFRYCTCVQSKPHFIRSDSSLDLELCTVCTDKQRQLTYSADTVESSPP